MREEPKVSVFVIVALALLVVLCGFLVMCCQGCYTVGVRVSGEVLPGVMLERYTIKRYLLKPREETVAPDMPEIRSEETPTFGPRSL